MLLTPDPLLKAEYQSEKEDQRSLLEREVSNFISWTWKTIIMAVLCVGAYVFYKEFYVPMQTKKALIKTKLQSQGSTVL